MANLGRFVRKSLMQSPYISITFAASVVGLALPIMRSFTSELSDNFPKTYSLADQVLFDPTKNAAQRERDLKEKREQEEYRALRRAGDDKEH